MKKSFCGSIKNLKHILDYKDTLIVVLLPILAIPLCLIDGKNDIGRPGCCQPSETSKICSEEDICEFDSTMVGRFGYSLIIIGGYWVTECLPIPLTALLPYVLGQTCFNLVTSILESYIM